MKMESEIVKFEDLISKLLHTWLESLVVKSNWVINPMTFWRETPQQVTNVTFEYLTFWKSKFTPLKEIGTSLTVIFRKVTLLIITGLLYPEMLRSALTFEMLLNTMSFI